MVNTPWNAQSISGSENKMPTYTKNPYGDLSSLMYGNAGVGKVGYAGIQTSDLQGGGDKIDSFGNIVKQVSAAENNGLTGLDKILANTINNNNKNTGGGDTGGGETGGGGAGGGTDNSDLIAKYKAGGWTDMNAILADIAAGGGSKFNNGGGLSTDVSQSDLDQIFKSLDERLSQTDAWKTSMTNQIGDQASTQDLTAQSNLTSGNATIKESEDTETKRAAFSLRELAQNANDLLSRLSQQFGGGSALQAAQTAAMRSINQTGGNIINTRDEGLNKLKNMAIALGETYKTEKAKIDKWKDEKINSIVQAIEEWKNTIAGQKTEVASSMKQNAINAARQFLTDTAKQDQIYKQNLDAWKIQRDAELEDYGKKITEGTQYDKQTYDSGINLPTGTSFGTSSNGTTTNSNNDLSGNYFTNLYSTAQKKKNEEEQSLTPSY